MKYIGSAALAAALLLAGSAAAAEAEKAPSVKIEIVTETDAPQKHEENTAPEAATEAKEKAAAEEKTAAEHTEEAAKPAEGEEKAEGEKEKAAADVKKEEKEADKADSEKEKKLLAIDGRALGRADFSVRGLSLGSSFADTEAVLGMPESIDKGSVRDVYGWKDMAVRFVHDLPAEYSTREDVTLAERVPGGADVISVSGADVLTARGVSVGTSRENVLRVYGRPAALLWDGKRESLYLTYASGEDMIVFTVKKDKVSNIRIAEKDKDFLSSRAAGVAAKGKRTTEDDFRIAGYALGETFNEHAWLSWEKKAINPEAELWYYQGFGVRFRTKDRNIRSFFLTDARMTTARGISVGDDQSTVEALYGGPEKLEVNHLETGTQNAYIYFSPDRHKVLIIYLSDATKKVVNVVIMNNPQIVHPVQHVLDELEALREKNAEGAK